ncbi:hypothetical protein KIN20_012840 [Parelaphostrongylus tenuis]|uniref:Uncharacterized protein n=1 Tax=Parelaphostrongylus tenuis TaxID=148309 RepID=A0AAD5MFS3_PARTN|nr:hypothetical protein KIN20_012840 [Parelaphostrongylus tenuis]
MDDNRERTRRMEDVLGSAQFAKTDRPSIQIDMGKCRRTAIPKLHGELTPPALNDIDNKQQK